MRRPLLALVLAIAAIGVLAAGLAALLDTPRPPRGASRGERLFYELCATCHGTDGRGTWRATLFLVRPPAPAGRRRAGRAPLLRALRRLPRPRRSRPLARPALPGPPRHPRRRRPPRSALRPVPLRHHQERRRAHRAPSARLPGRTRK